MYLEKGIECNSDSCISIRHSIRNIDELRIYLSYKKISSEKDLENIDKLIPGILKTTTLGYDGKGQYPIQKIEDIETMNVDFSKEYILEKLVKLKKEISVVLTRFGINNFQVYEPIENTHQNQILKHSKIPADVSKKISEQAKDCMFM